MTLRPALRPLLALVLAAGVVLAACGDDDEPAATGDVGTTASTAGDTGGSDYGGASTDDGSSDGAAGAGASGEPTVIAQDIAFAGDITVGPGGAFFFDNQDGTTHTLTADDGSFDSGEVSGGERSDAITAPDEPGDFPFHCEIHPSMTATLTVTG
jgi:plastocyanin